MGPNGRPPAAQKPPQFGPEKGPRTETRHFNQQPKLCVFHNIFAVLRIRKLHAESNLLQNGTLEPEFLNDHVQKRPCSLLELP